MSERELSLIVDNGGRSSAISISSTSAQSPVCPSGEAVFYSTVDCFGRAGSNPTALSDGTDMFFVGGNQYRVQLPQGHRMAFKTTAATGTVYFTPGGV